MSLFSAENIPADAKINGIKITPVDQLIFTISATQGNQVLFLASTTDVYAYQLNSISVHFGTASTSGTLQVEYLTGTTGSGSGTALLTTPISLSGTANTVYSAKPSTVKTLNPGDRLGIKLAGTLTNLANCVVQLNMQRV
jgi:hypothetical protein